jgi:hypothetical protein
LERLERTPRVTLNFEPPLGVERSVAIENKSAHGEPVEPLERLEQTFLGSGV